MRILRLALATLALSLAARSDAGAQSGARAGAAGERRAIHAAVVRAILREPHRDTLAATCVGLRSGRASVDPDSAFFATLQERGRGPVVPLGRCPPTYEIGERAAPVPPPRPPGARDPYRLSIVRVRVPRAGRAIVEVAEDHAASARRYECTATRAAGTWSAACRITYMAIF